LEKWDDFCKSLLQYSAARGIMSAATEQGAFLYGHHEFFCALFLLLLLLFYPKKVIAICAAENFQELKGLSQDAARIAVRRYFIIRRC
jgi:hypothetical protein